MIEIKRCLSLSPIEMDQWIALMAQLYSDDIDLSMHHINQLLNHPTTQLFIATNENKIIGSVILAWYPVANGDHGWIEDVIVDARHRGLQIGKSLVSHVIEEAKILGLKHLNLTSRPERIEANKLYQSLGFKQRDTNIYRLLLDRIKN